MASPAASELPLHSSEPSPAAAPASPATNTNNHNTSASHTGSRDPNDLAERAAEYLAVAAARGQVLYQDKVLPVYQSKVVPFYQAKIVPLLLILAAIYQTLRSKALQHYHVGLTKWHALVESNPRLQQAVQQANQVLHKHVLTPKTVAQVKKFKANNGLVTKLYAIIMMASFLLFVSVHHQMDQLDASSRGGYAPRRMQSLSELSQDDFYGNLQAHDHPLAAPIYPNTDGTAPYAYMFLIGGVHPDRPGYRGFLYNVMVASELLRQQGSISDRWLYLQCSPDADSDQCLPAHEARALAKLDIHVKYLDRPKSESFADITLEKFRMLQLTQYRRVMFLDADILPLKNLDYLMALSDGDHPVLQPNLVIASRGEPANAGCFMLEPKIGAYEELQRVIAQQRASAPEYPYWDKEVGWGHRYTLGQDEWQAIAKSGIGWRWHCAHTDQGLLYYWTKYHVQAVSIFRGDIVENWVASGKKDQHDQWVPIIEATYANTYIEKFAPTKRVTYQFKCDKRPSGDKCLVPYSNIAHFTGVKKPWQYAFDLEQFNSKHHVMMAGPYRAFFTTLFDLSERLELGITRDNVDEKIKELGDSPLGYKPGYGEGQHVKEKEEAKAAREQLAKEEEAEEKEADDDKKKKEEAKKVQR